MSMLRIVIAEDAAIMRDGLAQTLARRGHDVVAAVGDADALLHAVAEHRPDVAIVDVRMPPSHTDEGLRAAKAVPPPLSCSREPPAPLEGSAIC